MARTRNRRGGFLFGLFGKPKKSTSHHATKAKHHYGPGAALDEELAKFGKDKSQEHKSRKNKKSKRGGVKYSKSKKLRRRYK